MLRTKNTIKNIYSGILVQIIISVLGFISRKIFINIMGVELLGINALLTNILSMLGLVELGVGGAIYYSLYEPLANHNNEQIKAIMNLYAQIYKILGVVVAVLGIIMLPFLKFFIKEDVVVDIGYVRTIYLIFLLNSVLSYFLAYRRNILSADQKNYILNGYSCFFNIITYVLQIIIIYITHNFVIYISINVFLTFIQNVIIFKRTNKEYPYLKDKIKLKLDENIKKDIIKNAKSLFVVNIACYCVFGTDNILISMFAGVVSTGIYSNYYLVINSINTFINQIYQGIKASYGNLLVEKGKKEAFKIFEVLYFLTFWLMTFCSTCLLVLINPFIKLWLGNNMIFEMSVTIVLIYNFYTRGMTNAIEVVRNAAGLYSPYPFFKYWALIEGIVNLIASIILASHLNMGILGIFLGTSISTCVTSFVLPWNVYKYVFSISSKNYYIKYLLYNIVSIIVVLVTYYITNLLVINNISVEFVFKVICSIIIPNILILVLFNRTKEFIYIKQKFDIKELIRRRKNV